MLNKVFYFNFGWNEWNQAPTFKICIYLRFMTCICYTNYYNFYLCEDDDWIEWACIGIIGFCDNVLNLNEFSFPMQLSLSIPSPQGRDWRASGPEGPKCAWPDPPISSKCFIFIFIDSALIIEILHPIWDLTNNLFIYLIILFLTIT